MPVLPWDLSQPRPTRLLLPREDELIAGMYADKMRRVLGFITTVLPVPMGTKDSDAKRTGDSPWTNPKRIIPPGTTLRIVMISRFGDFGLTDNLSGEYGYGVRLDFEDAAMTDIRLTKETTPS